MRRGRRPFGLDPSRASRAKGEREEIGAFGSGVIIDSSGLIATTSDGLERNWPITVVLNDQREFDAEIVLTDRRTDLAILRTRKNGSDPAALAFSLLEPHPKMNFALTRRDAADLAAYISTLAQ